MADYPKLAKAPIVEGLIDIRVKPPKDFNIKKLEELCKNNSKKYPKHVAYKTWEGKFELSDDKQNVETTSGIIGYRCISEDETEIIQFRLDGFTFSKLKPYTSWKDIKPKAKALWKSYSSIIESPVDRVAVRYINNLNIPLPLIDFAEYLTAPPNMPNGLPQRVSSFFYRVEIPESSIGASAIVTQALEKVAPEITELPLILDIDVFKLDDFNKSEIWETLEQLRSFKNKIFFNSITDKLKEMYK